MVVNLLKERNKIHEKAEVCFFERFLRGNDCLDERQRVRSGRYEYDDKNDAAADDDGLSLRLWRTWFDILGYGCVNLGGFNFGHCRNLALD